MDIPTGSSTRFPSSFLKHWTSEAVKDAFTNPTLPATPFIGTSLRGKSLSALDVLDRVLQYGSSPKTPGGGVVWETDTCWTLGGVLGGKPTLGKGDLNSQVGGGEGIIVGEGEETKFVAGCMEVRVGETTGETGGRDEGVEADDSEGFKFNSGGGGNETNAGEGRGAGHVVRGSGGKEIRDSIAGAEGVTRGTVREVREETGGATGEVGGRAGGITWVGGGR